MQKTFSKPVTSALDQSAALLENAHSPLILTGALDLKAAAAAVSLARRLGGVLDHVDDYGSGPGQEQGTMGTVPGEAFVRADVVIVAGALGEAARRDTALQRLLTAREGRGVLTLGDEAAAAIPAERFALGGRGLAETLGALHALSKGEKTALSDADRDAAQALVDGQLAAAKYGVFVFDPTAIDDLALFMLMALADTLSANTRWTLLPVGRARGQPELLRMAQALTGLPPPLNFGGLKPAHDARLWRAKEVLARGEADCLVWVCADSAAPPSWARAARTVAISARPDAVQAADIGVQIGEAGVDHVALMEVPATGFIAATGATPIGASPRAGDVLEALLERLGPGHQGVAA